MLNTNYEETISTLVDYTVLSHNNLIVVAAAATASRTITLPLARVADEVFIYNASGYSATIAVQSGDTLFGAASVPPGGMFRYQAASKTNWYTFGGGGSGSGGLIAYQQTCPVSAFTDGGSTSGTLVLGRTIPAGAVYVQTLYSALVGFTGDVSATAILGDGSDTDRYVTSTANFFTTAAAGVAAGAPSGTAFHATAVTTPTLTVTSNSDFTLVKTAAAGVVVVTMMYYSPF